MTYTYLAEISNPDDGSEEGYYHEIVFTVDEPATLRDAWLWLLQHHQNNGSHRPHRVRLYQHSTLSFEKCDLPTAKWNVLSAISVMVHSTDRMDCPAESLEQWIDYQERAKRDLPRIPANVPEPPKAA